MVNATARHILHILVAVVIVVVLSPPHPTHAADTQGDTVARVSDLAARAALKAFSAAYKSEEAEQRLAAVTTLGAVQHPRVAALLLKLAGGKDEVVVRQEAFLALGRQAHAGRAAGAGLVRLIVAEADQRRRARMKAVPDYPMNRFGDPILHTPEAKAWHVQARARAAMWLAALRALVRLDVRPPGAGVVLREFFDDADDELVAYAIETCGNWSAWPALPALLDLYRRYPTKDTWDSINVGVNRGGYAAAHDTWKARYGHPEKRRPRPVVYAAIQSAIPAITGETCETPSALAELLDREAVARKIRD